MQHKKVISKEMDFFLHTFSLKYSAHHHGCSQTFLPH